MPVASYFIPKNRYRAIENKHFIIIIRTHFQAIICLNFIDSYLWKIIEISLVMIEFLLTRISWI